MKNIFEVGLVVILILLFFYFGYKDDYKRDPKEFIRTIIGVPIAIFASFFGFIGIAGLIKKWMNKEEQEKED